jgi:hypothetical protein
MSADETEQMILAELRRARANRRRPSTFVIRVVDGLVQFMVAEPRTGAENYDIRHVDHLNGSR